MKGDKSGSTAVGKSVDGKLLNMSDSISIALTTPIETAKYRYWTVSLETNFYALTLEPEDFLFSRSFFFSLCFSSLIVLFKQLVKHCNVQEEQAQIEIDKLY